MPVELKQTLEGSRQSASLLHVSSESDYYGVMTTLTQPSVLFLNMA